jgi:pyridoxamine 5'-phosphate oxidase
VHESSNDIARLQDLLDRSYAAAGAHLLSIHTPERRLSAEQLARRLTGMRLLTLATVSSDGRPIAGPVDGIFYRGAFHFGSSPDSLRFAHIARRPQVSATHLPGEDLGVTVHGRAVPIDVKSPEQAGFRDTLLEVYVPRYGEEWQEFLDSNPVYARIEAERLFAFALEAADEAPEFARPLREADVDPDPAHEFAVWFDRAREAGVHAPEAAALATATPDGVPSVRMVLVKERSAGGFVFYTNFDSRKGHELRLNPRAALLFYWDQLGRQVRVEGDIARVDPEESARHIRNRPRASQLSALASPQSQVVKSREQLEHWVAELATRHSEADLPLPDHWGGLRLRPRRYEFWQHREDRLHDRLLYTPGANGGWRIERLAP